MQGYRYCDLLLSRGRAAEARDRAAQTLRVGAAHKLVLDIALDTLTLGRAHLALALQSLAGGASAESARADARAAAAKLDEAVEGLRASGRKRLCPLAACSPAPPSAAPSAIGTARRATSTRSRRSPSRGRCGSISAIARSSARGSRSARREAFAPLNGLVEPSPPPPALPDAAEAAAAH